MTRAETAGGGALARLVGARLTHDLAGPLSTLAAAAGLESGSTRSDALMGETLAELRTRVQLYGAVFGHADAMRGDELAALLAGAPGAHRVSITLDPDLSSPLPGPLAQVLLAAAMLGMEALPRGGSVALGQGSGDALTVLPQGRMAAWPHALLERLAGLPPPQPDTPRSLLAPWLLLLARELGCGLSFALGGPASEGRIPPLLLRAAR